MSEPSFLDRLEAVPVTAPGTPCTVARALRVLSEADAAHLRAALLDTDRYTNRRIAIALTQAGVRIREQTVGRHRRKGCGCQTSSTA